MNIYNDSNGSVANYPSNPAFGDISVNNIYINNALSIKNLAKGNILIGEDTTEDVGELVLGNQDYVLSSDKNNTGLPIWKNTVKLDYAEMDDLKLTGLIKGDILCGGNDAPFISRLPVGLNNQILYSNGTEIGWQAKTVGNHYFYFPGSLNNVPNLLGLIVGGNGWNLTAGRLYKITISAQIVSTTETTFALYFNSVLVPNLFFLYNANGDISKTFIYTAVASGAYTIELTGASLVGTSSLYDFRAFAEEY